MAFDSLSEKLQNVFKNLRSKGRLTEDDVKTALREVKMALLEADVNFKVVKNFTKAVQERAVGSDVMNGLNPGQMVIKIVTGNADGIRDDGDRLSARTADYRYHDGRTSGCRQDYDHGKAGRKDEAEGKEAASGGL